MKKIFKKLKLRDLLFFIVGGIIIGSIGITATTYVLKSSEIQYTNDKSVQQAIDELFVKAENCGRSNETLSIGTIITEGYKITIPYTGSYPTIGCVYGTDEKYGSIGTINNNTCTFTGTSSNQKLYYKISALTTDGKIHEYSGSTTTGASGVTIVKTGLPTGVKAIVYLDPTNIGTVCNESNSNGSGESGCMKWYAYEEDSNSYTMILDHNITSTEWYLRSTKIKGWKVTPRLITGQEVANIVGNSEWSNEEKQVQTIRLNKYSWLCSTTYWINTTYKDSSDNLYAFYIDSDSMQMTIKTTNSSSGIRPVITISKSNL